MYRFYMYSFKLGAVKEKFEMSVNDSDSERLTLARARNRLSHGGRLCDWPPASRLPLSARNRDSKRPVEPSKSGTVYRKLSVVAP